MEINRRHLFQSKHRKCHSRWDSSCTSASPHDADIRQNFSHELLELHVWCLRPALAFRRKVTWYHLNLEHSSHFHTLPWLLEHFLAGAAAGSSSQSLQTEWQLMVQWLPAWASCSLCAQLCRAAVCLTARCRAAPQVMLPREIFDSLCLPRGICNYFPLYHREQL